MTAAVDRQDPYVRVRAPEPAYPIFFITARWVQDTPPDIDRKVHATSLEGLPLGRMHNSTGLYRMYPYEAELGWVERGALAWWEKYRNTPPQDGRKYQPCGNHADSCIIKVEFSGREQWCPAWFSHWTFDRGQSDAEVLESFREYVWRVQDRADFREDEEHPCLMGAEDRWRWSGVEDDGETRTDPPCRCKVCKQQGVIRINH